MCKILFPSLCYQASLYELISRHNVGKRRKKTNKVTNVIYHSILAHEFSAFPSAKFLMDAKIIHPCAEGHLLPSISCDKLYIFSKQDYIKAIWFNFLKSQYLGGFSDDTNLKWTCYAIITDFKSIWLFVIGLCLMH